MLRVGTFKLYGILSPRDLDTEQAEVIARHNLPRWELYNSAIADPKIGLVIFNIFHAINSRNAYSITGFHLQSPRCGYEGSGPLTAARILELFRFGEREALYESLRRGGDKTQLCLTRPTTMSIRY